MKSSAEMAVATALILAMLALTGCASPRLIYVNDRYPSYTQSDLDRDVYECRRENTHHSTVVVGSYAMTGPEVNEAMVRQCLAGRGWRLAKESKAAEPPSAPRETSPATKPPEKVLPAPCESGMYWSSVKRACVPYSDR
jgi:hypothetical protein